MSSTSFCSVSFISSTTEIDFSCSTDSESFLSWGGDGEKGASKEIFVCSRSTISSLKISARSSAAVNTSLIISEIPVSTRLCVFTSTISGILSLSLIKSSSPCFKNTLVEFVISSSSTVNSTETSSFCVFCSDACELSSLLGQGQNIGFITSIFSGLSIARQEST